jgi:imidazolonepropionase-like amidohydrolase
MKSRFAGKAGALLATLFLLVGCAPNVRTADVDWPAEPLGDLVIQNVAVVDVETGRRVLGRDVFIRDGRITAIEPTGSTSAGELRTIDGLGASILPGLIDMHGHVTNARGPFWTNGIRDALGDPQANLRSYLYSGVTTVLDPSDSTGEAVARREKVRQRKLVGPRIFTAGKPITCPGGHPVAIIDLFAPRWIAWFIAPRVATQVESREEAQDAVDALAAEGVDIVKVYVDRIPAQAPRMSVDTLNAIAERARERGVRSVAHIGTTQDAIDTGEAGVSLWMHGIAKERIRDDHIDRLAAFNIPMVATIEAQDRIVRGLKGPIDPIPMERQTVPKDVLESFYPPPQGFSMSALGFGSRG